MADTTLSQDMDDFLTEANGTLLFRPDITGLAGGTATDLDSITTTGLTVAVTHAMIFVGSTTFSVYALVSGTDAESSPDVIRPDDYATTTNEKVWKWVL